MKSFQKSRGNFFEKSEQGENKEVIQEKNIDKQWQSWVVSEIVKQNRWYVIKVHI